MFWSFYFNLNFVAVLRVTPSYEEVCFMYTELQSAYEKYTLSTSFITNALAISALLSVVFYKPLHSNFMKLRENIFTDFLSYWNLKDNWTFYVEFGFSNWIAYYLFSFCLIGVVFLIYFLVKRFRTMSRSLSYLERENELLEKDEK